MSATHPEVLATVKPDTMKTKRRPGRPPSDKGQRPISLHITLHADEHEAIGSAAKAAKVKPTRFVRDAALRAAKGFNKKVCKALAFCSLVVISLLPN